MTELKGYWTNRDSRGYLYQIGFDFIAQLEKFLNAEGMSRDEFARLLGVSKGRVSQVMNNPGNLQLLTIIEWTLKLGRKVSIVAYDDGDRTNKNGPVPSEIIEQCWNLCGSPTEFIEGSAWTAITSNESAPQEAGTLDFAAVPLDLLIAQQQMTATTWRATNG